MKSLIRLTVMVAVIVLSLMLAGCQEKGPAQEAGEKIDEAVEDTKEAVEGAVNPKGPAEKAGEEVDEAVEATKEKAAGK